jgi:hypothetical protein
MTQAPMPTRKDIEELTAFLPVLYAPGFKAATHWHGGKPDERGVIHMPYPEYHPFVDRFFRLLGQPCWLDYGYYPEESARMLNRIETLTLPEIRSLLTFCVRGERFSDGHWAEMIELGHIRRILERLAVLGESLPD